MVVHIERIKRLFPKEVCEAMLKMPKGYGTCHYNSYKAVLDFSYAYDIEYCEGYINGFMGHAFCKYTDKDGRVHYFDISQEYNKAHFHFKGGLKDVELVKEFDRFELYNTFAADKESHLISVPDIKGNPTYAESKKIFGVELTSEVYNAVSLFNIGNKK